MKIKNIGLVGAGVMGSDIAIAVACYDFNVLLKDVNDKALEKSKNRIKRNYKMLKMINKKAKALSLEDLLTRIRFTKNYKGFENVDFVIESVNEDWDLKQKVYRELRNVCSEDVFYATNTSCISVTKIASLLPKPEHVIGMHFMNPVPLKKMVETVRGYHTSSETEKTLTEFLKNIDKNPVVVNDFPGFVSNRLSHLFMNEAAFLIQDGVADPKQVDIIFKHGYGHKMGPLETADLIGLDTVVQSLDVLYKSYQDIKYRCCPLLQNMVDAGLLGRKTGKGFYEYKNLETF